jgi:hypothetical protein
MGCNDAINNLTAAYNGTYWQGVNADKDNLSSQLIYTGDVGCIKSNWDYGITLNEDAIKDIVEKITKHKETAKITPDEGPEIPKWTGFLPI